LQEISGLSFLPRFTSFLPRFTSFSTHFSTGCTQAFFAHFCPSNLFLKNRRFHDFRHRKGQKRGEKRGKTKKIEKKTKKKAKTA